jgi:aminoglycoside 6'-N-acetyltransferase I
VSDPVPTVRRATRADIDTWLALRVALWPDQSPDAMRLEMPAMLDDPRWVVLLALWPHDEVVGMAEANTRTDYVNGCETSPVGFLEAIYVVPAARRQGVARRLVDAVAAWTRSNGLTELASDALPDNTDSHGMHRALGFSETERVVFFRRRV